MSSRMAWNRVNLAFSEAYSVSESAPTSVVPKEVISRPHAEIISDIFYEIFDVFKNYPWIHSFYEIWTHVFTFLSMHALK